MIDRKKKQVKGRGVRHPGVIGSLDLARLKEGLKRIRRAAGPLTEEGALRDLAADVRTMLLAQGLWTEQDEAAADAAPKTVMSATGFEIGVDTRCKVWDPDQIIRCELDDGHLEDHQWPPKPNAEEVETFKRGGEEATVATIGYAKRIHVEAGAARQLLTAAAGVH